MIKKYFCLEGSMTFLNVNYTSLQLFFMRFICFCYIRPHQHRKNVI